MQLNRLIIELSQGNILSPEIKTCIVRILSRKESKLMLPEEKARVKIDKQLRNVGWDIVSRNEYLPNSTVAVSYMLIVRWLLYMVLPEPERHI